MIGAISHGALPIYIKIKVLVLLLYYMKSTLGRDFSRSGFLPAPPKGAAQNGFTIIEILLVLALIGLILLVILLAVPALNRSSRNHTRKAAVNYIASEMLTYFYANGNYPHAGSGPLDKRSAFVDNLKKSGPTSMFEIRYTEKDGSHEYPYSGSDAPVVLDEALDTISIEHGHTCNDDPSVGPGSANYPLTGSTTGSHDHTSFAIWTLLETPDRKSYCVDNSLKLGDG